MSMGTTRTVANLDDLLSRLGVKPSPEVWRTLLADQVEGMLDALPPDTTDQTDLILRARLEGYAAGLRGDEMPTRADMEGRHEPSR